MIRIAVVDDNEIFCQVAKKSIQHMSINEEYFVDIFVSSIEFLKQKGKYQIVILDIDMPEIDGIEVSRQLENISISIIFLTSFENKMKDAFRRNVHGYVMKEEMESKLPIVLSKEIEFINQSKNISFKTTEGIIGFRFDDIRFFEAKERKTLCFTNQGTYEIINKTLSEVLSLLNDWFLQINRYQIINIKHIYSFHSFEFIIKNDKRKFFVSRDRRSQVIKKYTERMLHED